MVLVRYVVALWPIAQLAAQHLNAALAKTAITSIPMALAQHVLSLIAQLVVQHLNVPLAKTVTISISATPAPNAPQKTIVQLVPCHQQISQILK